MSQIHFGLTNTQMCYESTIDALIREVSCSAELQLKPEAIDYLKNTWRQKLKNTGVCYPKINNLINTQQKFTKTQQAVVQNNLSSLDSQYPILKEEPQILKKIKQEENPIKQSQIQQNVTQNKKKIEVEINSSIRLEQNLIDEDEDEALFNQQGQKRDIKEPVQEDKLFKPAEIKEDNQESLSDLECSDEYINNRINIKNQIFGHYEKVHKQKDKWKAILKDMIGRINEKEYIFNFLSGDFIFETKK